MNGDGWMGIEGDEDYVDQFRDDACRIKGAWEKKRRPRMHDLTALMCGMVW